MKKFRPLLALVLLGAVVLSACSLVGNDSTEATAQPENITNANADTTDDTTDDTPDETTSEPVAGTATIDSLDILILESFPVQINVIASGNLADGCTRLGEEAVAFDSTTFTVELPTIRPGDVACTEALVPFDKVISLDVLGLPAGTYTVNVNGTSDTFTLDVDNVADGGGETAGVPDTISTGAISGRLWSDICSVTGSGDSAVPSDGCVALGDGSYAANGVSEAAEPGIAGLEVNLGLGSCPSTGLASSSTNANGYYSFTGLASGTYCVSIDALGEQNTALLIPGEWTFPPLVGAGTNEATLTVADGEVSAAIDFGWDSDSDAEEVADDGTGDDPVATPPPSGCTDSASFIVDVTIPDDTVINAGASFTKTWKILNSGTCTWENYSLAFAEGELLADSETFPVFITVPPNATIDLSIFMTGPDVNGTYRSDWHLQNANGVTFGLEGDDPTFWVQIVVLDGAEPEALVPFMGVLGMVLIPAGFGRWVKRKADSEK